jgi:YihY family inner membrane protein
MSNLSTTDVDGHNEETRGRRLLKRIDVWQQGHRGPSFLIAVLLRYKEDRGRDYGALLSYFGFISLFPLLLVLVTVLGIVLEGHAELRDQILDSVYSRIPLLGAQLRQSQTVLNSSGWVLVVGLLAATWSGLAVIKRTQDAFNLQWGVPPFRRPGFIIVQLRSLGALSVVGVGIIATTAATSVVALLPGLPWEGRLLGGLLAICLNIAVLTVAFRVLTQAGVPWRKFYAGGVVGGVAFWGLQLIGATYVGHVVKGASDVYGAFAVVFGLLVWIALLARVTLLASEINVVLSKRFWPRSLSGGMVTEGDRRAIAQTARRVVVVPDRRSADFEGT